MPKHQNTSSHSPFRPGYGREPLIFGGHEQEFSEISDVFRTLDFGRNQSSPEIRADPGCDPETERHQDILRDPLRFLRGF